MMRGMPGWKVWGELRRRPNLELEWAWLPGRNAEIEEYADGSRVITLGLGQDPCDRRAALAHELVHDDTGLLFEPDTPAYLVSKGEMFVDRETARRLVPIDELEVAVKRAVLDGECVGWREVADWFEVPRYVAEEAMRQLEQRARGRHAAGKGLR